MTATTTAEAPPTELPAASPVTSGIVRWFSHKGFGFIDGLDGTEIYVHHSAIIGSGFRTLPRGAQVRFGIRLTRRGPEAVAVVQVGGDL